MLTPAVFWKRASVANRKDDILPGYLLLILYQTAVILGGAGIGSAIGLLAHHGRTVTGDPAPRVRIPENPVSGQP